MTGKRSGRTTKALRKAIAQQAHQPDTVPTRKPAKQAMVLRHRTPQGGAEPACLSCHPMARIGRTHLEEGEKAKGRTAPVATDSTAHQRHGVRYARETGTSTMP